MLKKSSDAKNALQRKSSCFYRQCTPKCRSHRIDDVVESLADERLFEIAQLLWRDATEYSLRYGARVCAASRMVFGHGVSCRQLVANCRVVRCRRSGESKLDISGLLQKALRSHKNGIDRGISKTCSPD